MNNVNSEKRWIRLLKKQKAQWKTQELLSRVERLKDVDPRNIVGNLYDAKFLTAGYDFMRLIGKEALYELYRHTIGRNRVLRRPIFLVGMPHSGTTIAMKIVSLHPMITNASELNTYWHPGDYLNLRCCNHVKRASDCNEKEKKRIHGRLLFEKWIRGNKPIFLNKNPNNTVTIEYIKACFPDSFIVHVVRDGRAVVNSLMHGLPDDIELYDRYKRPEERINPWPGVKPPEWRDFLNENPIIQHAYQWKLCVEFVLEREKDLLPNYRLLKYEELCKNTTEVVSEIWNAAGLPINDEIIERLPKRLDNKNFKYKNMLSKKDIASIESIISDTLAKFQL